MTSLTIYKRLMLATAFLPIQSFAQAQLGAGSASHMDAGSSRTESRSVETRAPERAVETRVAESRQVAYRNTEVRNMDAAAASGYAAPAVRESTQYSTGAQPAAAYRGGGYAGNAVYPGLAAGGGAYRGGGSSAPVNYIPSTYHSTFSKNASYCATEYTHHKVKDIRSRQLLRYQLLLSIGWYWPDYFGAFYGYSDYPVWNAANTATHSDTEKRRSVHPSYDGYVVYAKDTIPGIISMERNGVTVSTQIDAAGQSSSFAYHDRHLQAIVVFNGEGYSDLVIKRPTPDSKKMYRVLHEGKLCVYDRVFNFITPYSVNFDFVYVLSNETAKNNGTEVAYVPKLKRLRKISLLSDIGKIYGDDADFGNGRNQDILNCLGGLK